MTTTQERLVALRYTIALLTTVLVALGVYVIYDLTQERNNTAADESPQTAFPSRDVSTLGGDLGDPQWELPEWNGPTTRSGQNDDARRAEGRDHQPHPKQTEDHSSKPAWRTVIDGFAHDFNGVTGTSEKEMRQWHARISRWVTPYLADAYANVDPHELPNTTVHSIEVESSGSEAASAVIQYRGIPPVWVIVQPTPDGWRITQAEPYSGHATAPTA